jgi:hypothetical protein
MKLSREGGYYVPVANRVHLSKLERNAVVGILHHCSFSWSRQPFRGNRPVAVSAAGKAKVSHYIQATVTTKEDETKPYYQSFVFL